MCEEDMIDPSRDEVLLTLVEMNGTLSLVHRWLVACSTYFGMPC